MLLPPLPPLPTLTYRLAGRIEDQLLEALHERRLGTVGHTDEALLVGEHDAERVRIPEGGVGRGFGVLRGRACTSRERGW